jgi:hypothetical protein
MARLRTLAAKAAPSVAELAAVVIAVAEITPSKKGRLWVLARERGDRLAALERTGLIDARHG